MCVAERRLTCYKCRWWGGQWWEKVPDKLVNETLQRVLGVLRIFHLFSRTVGSHSHDISKEPTRPYLSFKKITLVTRRREGWRGAVVDLRQPLSQDPGGHQSSGVWALFYMFMCVHLFNPYRSPMR